jgi:hypothetical protein
MKRTRKVAVLALFMIINIGVSGQGPSKQSFSKISFGKTLIDTMSFHKKWDYPWYIVTDENGKPAENTLGDSISANDTVHLYYTADCETDHQGLHTVRYCDASLKNGIITLKFGPELPAYAGELSVIIKGDQFRCEYEASYPAPTQNISWQIISQQLLLEKTNYKSGETIKGHIHVEFLESGTDAGGKKFSDKYYFKGYFKTPLLK